MVRALAVVAMTSVATVSLAPSAHAETAAGDRRCAEYGPRFVYSESTGLCIRISGRVRADFTFGDGGSDSNTSAGATLDIRKDTELGPFRLVIETPK